MERNAAAAPPWLDDYCFSQDGVFLVPVEQQAPGGIPQRFRERIAAETGLGEDWLATFEAALALYRERTSELSTRTPMYWFPPRVQHVCVVTAPERVRPFFQPFYKSAWRVLASDFDPSISNAEFAVFQLVQAERLSLMQDALGILACNLSYWLVRSDDEVERFARACADAPEPTGSFWRSFAQALEWIRELHHDPLDPPPRIAAPEPLVTVPRTGLVLPKSRQRDVQQLQLLWKRVVESGIRAYLEHHGERQRNHAEELCEWLRDESPRVVVTGRGNRVLWSADRADDLDSVRSNLQGITRKAADSLRADLALIDRRSRDFFGSLRAPQELPHPEAQTADQNGLSYMHIERREIAYNLQEARMQRLREPAAPFERFMLGARTIHEWGHLATSAGWVDVPEAQHAGHERLLEECGALFGRIVAAAPRAVRDVCRNSLDQLGRGEANWGPALARLALSRVEDFQSNLLATRFCAPEEIETYVRNNVRSLVHDYGPEGMFHRLARYAYEFQYLRFSGMADPREFFFASTWFAEQYFKLEVLDEKDWDELAGMLRRLCNAYEVDERFFSFP